MAASNGDLTQQLIEGGLTPMAARAIANALANAASPQFSQGRDSTDATPREALRLITADTRRYSLTNLDYPVAAPFRDRLESTAGQFAGGPEDHPYKDSQPVTSAAPLANPRVQAGDYIAVDNLVDGGAEVSRVRLKLRLEPGRHLRLDPSTKSLEAVPLLTRTQGKYLSAEFVETDAGTELVISLRGLGFLDDSTELDLLLANGDSRKALVFPTDAAVGPASLAAGGTRSLTSTPVRLADGTSQNLLAWTDGTVTAAQPMCRAFVVFDATRDTTGASNGNATDRLIIQSVNVARVNRLNSGSTTFYDCIFTTALPDANYVALGTGERSGANAATFTIDTGGAYNSGQFRFQFAGNTAGTNIALANARVAVFR